MNANEKLQALGGEAFYHRFIEQMKVERRNGCLEWLGFGIKSTGCLAIEANIARSPARISFKFSLAEGKTACCINLRSRSDTFDGNYSQWKPAFVELISDALARARGPHMGIRLLDGDAYFKPFGMPRDVNQVDIYFEAWDLSMDSLAQPCAVLNENLELNLREAVLLSLGWLELCDQRLPE